MRFWAVTVSSLPAQAMALYPFLLVKSERLKTDERIIRHEKIHFYQQLEMLIIFFYPVYLLNYLYNLVKFRSHGEAYFQISFEREAYKNENDLAYLKKRTPFAWLKYL
ncbi:MAG: hypothetical protein EOO89_27255 [Pedobacter sp.]|nr:MAG: hypothetical protein EOO89_27255 [Pedobacter sp.]